MFTTKTWGTGRCCNNLLPIPQPQPLVFVTVVMMAKKIDRHCSCPNTACRVLGYIDKYTGNYTLIVLELYVMVVVQSAMDVHEAHFTSFWREGRRKFDVWATEWWMSNTS